MEQNTIAQKITRRIFNGLLAALAFFGFGKRHIEAKSIDQYCQEEKTKDEATDYMEILILPEDLVYPYSPKVREVLYNHIIAGKSRYEIKQWILEHSKVIKVPIK